MGSLSSPLSAAWSRTDTAVRPPRHLWGARDALHWDNKHTAYRRVVISAHFSCGRIFFSLSPHLLACTKAKPKGDLEHIISKGLSTSKIDRDEGSPASMGPAEICNKTHSGGCIGLAENWSFRGNIFKQELETAGSKCHCAEMTAEANNSIYSSFRVGVYGKKHRMEFLQQAVRQIPSADTLVDVVSVPVRVRG